MPWKIIPSDYDPTDPTTLHDDELIAIELALSEGMTEPQNEYNPRWRAREKIRPLAVKCNGDGDPIQLLPPGAGASPNWESYAHDGQAPGANHLARPNGDDATPARAAQVK